MTKEEVQALFPPGAVTMYCGPGHHCIAFVSVCILGRDATFYHVPCTENWYWPWNPKRGSLAEVRDHRYAHMRSSVDSLLAAAQREKDAVYAATEAP